MVVPTATIISHLDRIEPENGIMGIRRAYADSPTDTLLDWFARCLAAPERTGMDLIGLGIYFSRIFLQFVFVESEEMFSCSSAR